MRAIFLVKTDLIHNSYQFCALFNNICLFLLEAFQYIYIYKNKLNRVLHSRFVLNYLTIELFLTVRLYVVVLILVVWFL